MTTTVRTFVSIFRQLPPLPQQNKMSKKLKQPTSIRKFGANVNAIVGMKQTKNQTNKNQTQKDAVD